MNLKKLSQTLTKSSTPASRHSSERTNICLRLDLHGNVYNLRVQRELRHPTPGRLRIMSQREGCQLQVQLAQPFLLQSSKFSCPSVSNFPEFSETPPTFIIFVILRKALSPLLIEKIFFYGNKKIEIWVIIFNFNSLSHF